MTRSEIEAKLKQIIIDTLKDEIALEHLNLEDKFEELGINSVIFIKTVVMIELDFNIEFDDSDLNVANFTDLKSLTDHVERKVNSAL
ncbi:acyl carrier protein [Paenibacillus borealis]|uniref:acyl carrier protein n=1 Tax=Paenibacillus borealis TaxID=160799 RepID=UPI0006946FF7|nr:acyl carrier protein [Paenibacillus borealis]